MRRRIATVLGAALLAAAPFTAHAGKDLAFSIGIAGPGFSVNFSDPAPVYYAPAPVYVRPAPVYHYAPRPVVVAPAYYAPRPIVVRPGYHRHHPHAYAFAPGAVVLRGRY